jgi:signal transduction histidine kinase
MSDIVWAVDPRRDRLADLVHRMRQAAYDLAEADGVRVDFSVPSDEEIEATGLPPEHKRQIYLTFKEAMNNVVRHARARTVRVAVSRDGSTLLLEVRDDGQGFDAGASHAGLGLASLRRRAAVIGGQLELESVPGVGTVVRLRVGLGRWHGRKSV